MVTRARQEERYQEELRQAMLSYLGFAVRHRELAERVADAASARAAAVGSGRVGHEVAHEVAHEVLIGVGVDEFLYRRQTGCPAPSTTS